MEERYTNSSAVTGAESQNDTDAGSAAMGGGEKTKPLASYTHADGSHKALLLLLLALREAFPAFQSSAPEGFSSLASPKHPQLPQRILASKQVARKGPLPSKPSSIFWHFIQILPMSPNSQ